MSPTRRALLGWLVSVPVVARFARAPSPDDLPLEERTLGGKQVLTRQVRSADEVYSYLRRYHPAMLACMARTGFTERSLIATDTLTIRYTLRETSGYPPVGAVRHSEEITFTAVAPFSIDGRPTVHCA